ncbi:MAG: patatin-like phospholipase family protein, partial [Gemmatimonadetes bacterium]|nr:patatin-like phospholipase family protein [Gemmatimonadota bacterium]NIQ55555.1 patatin-like phospholipase family protein [Gemmatimonadota bacterium]NIU75763.1 patatin-like phospholipase family protein [Gammaproteobacteria bacterium]NIX45410.1 patatin-like phospholipase family protein [Gemmatimonadota bacterium]
MTAAALSLLLALGLQARPAPVERGPAGHPEPTGARATVGLALSGGSARGFAHIG